MDKRQEKTIDAIYKAFTKLINEKDFDEITIQDILDESNIGRSTFYCHFKTKNDLLLKISKDIFDHVFSHSLQEEKTHDFSKDLLIDYRHLVTHIFYHIHDERELIKGIINSKGNALFIDGFKHHLFALVDSYYNNYPSKDFSIPMDLKKEILVDDFVTLIRYWVRNNFKESPEQMSGYFVEIFKAL